MTYQVMWGLKQYLISNCRQIKKLSYFDRFLAIKKDKRTKPNGRLIYFATK